MEPGTRGGSFSLRNCSTARSYSVTRSAAEVFSRVRDDYAYLRGDSGVENQVAMFLLPDGTDVGSRLLWENFEWTLL